MLPQPFIIVNNDELLKKYCSSAQQKPTVILDTEFVRVKTYSPQLGLIQLFDGEHLCLIDPLAIKDFSPFVALLKNPQVEKVLHGSSEDLRIFKEQFNQLPVVFWDTQIMAQFLNIGMCVGLKTLLEEFLDIHLEKSETRTNWLKRPLSQKQLEYAALDVEHLFTLFNDLKTRLKKTPWFDACFEECQLLKDSVNKPQDPLSSFLNTRMTLHFSPLQLSRLKNLVEWREKQAQKRNLAVNFVVKKDKIYLLAKNGAKNISDLIELGLAPYEIRYYGKGILRVLEKSKNNTDIPKLDIEIKNKNYKEYFKLCKIYLETIITNELPSELFLSKKHIHDFLVWYLSDKKNEESPLILTGWRSPYGKKLLSHLKNIL